MADYKEDSKQENFVAERWLLYRFEKEKAYQEAREEILELSPSTSTVDISSLVPGEISDKTGNRGVKLASLGDIEEWLKLLQEFEESLPREKRIYLKLRREYRYHRGRKGWTSAIQYRFSSELQKELGTESDNGLRHRKTYYYWWQEIVQELAREALRRGLL